MLIEMVILVLVEANLKSCACQGDVGASIFGFVSSVVELLLLSLWQG